MIKYKGELKHFKSMDIEPGNRYSVMALAPSNTAQMRVMVMGDSSYAVLAYRTLEAFMENWEYEG